ncbi:unnamed protein product, partial [Candidula unifasciata]
MTPNVYCATLVVVIVLTGEVFAQMQICTFTPRMDGTYANMTFNGIAKVNKEAVTGTQPNFTVNPNTINYMGMQVDGSGPAIQVEFNVEVKIIIWDVGIPAGSVRIDRSYVGYNSSSISSSSSVSIYFMASPSGDGGVHLPEGNTGVFASVYFTYQGTVYGAVIPSICLKRVTVLFGSIFYEQGFTALTFFVMLIVGILLALLGVWLFLRIQQGRAIFPITLK